MRHALHPRGAYSSRVVVNAPETFKTTRITPGGSAPCSRTRMQPSKGVARRACLTMGLLSLSVGAQAASDAERRCSDLQALKLEVSRIVRTEVIRGRFTTPGGVTIEPLPDFCRVVVHTSFSADSSVNAEVWLPLSTPSHFPASLGKPMTRPLCPYPSVARYQGRGDITRAESFVCGDQL